MKKVAVVYHSGYGHTARQAEAVAAGARGVAGIDVKLLSVETPDDAFWAELAEADALIFGAPTYMGSVSAPFKSFMDASSKVWFAQGWKGKLAAGFTTSASQSGDKLNSLVQLSIFAAQQSMIWVSLGLLPGNNSSKGAPSDLNRLGSYLGAMAQANADQGADAMLQSDLDTAAHLGRRVAEMAQRLAA
jgi:multimeric flavodoxin WrbA